MEVEESVGFFVSVYNLIVGFLVPGKDEGRDEINEDRNGGMTYIGSEMLYAAAILIREDVRDHVPKHRAANGVTEDLVSVYSHQDVESREKVQAG